MSYNFYGLKFAEQDGPVQQAILAKKWAPVPKQNVIRAPSYRIRNGEFEPHTKLIYWDENPPCGEYLYRQEGTGVFRDDSVYVLPQDTVKNACPLTLSETQMLSAPINSAAEINPSPIEWQCGGYYTVNKQTRQVLKKDYFMGPSDGYPTYQEAKYAADNLVLPKGMTKVHFL